MTTFPKNPTDGMIFEAIPGLFYQFSARENCWVRVDGLNALGLATPTQDGMMSPDDFNKLNGLLIPPPQATITGEECKVKYTHGQVALVSTDDSLSVKPTLQLTNNSGNAGVIDQPWAIHRNTAGYDFRLNVDQLLETMKTNGNFTQVKIQGRQGPKGKPGKDGIDNLQTGPKGPPGKDGKNSPYNGTIGSDPNSFVLADANSNRAIVDIVADPVTNTLVATRANIGNPNACPTEVAPKALTSPLVLVLSKQENALIRTLQSTNDCVNPCTVCVSTLHYLNLELILDSFFERFQELAAELKTQKENLAASWLRTLINVFTDQKFALCCALENCKSAQRNKQERQYIESQRIAAAAANQQLVIDGANNRQNVNMDADKTCPVESPTNVRRGVGCDCVLQYTLDGKLHSTDPRALFLQKPPCLVDVRTSSAFQTDRVGVLDVHLDLQRQTTTPPTESLSSSTRSIIVQTNVVPPPAISFITDWLLKISNFSVVVNPPRPTVSQIVVKATAMQNGNAVASWIYSNFIGSDIPDQTITLLPAGPNNEFSNADQKTPVELIIEVISSTTYGKDEPASFYANDVTIGPVVLSGTSTVVNVDLTLQHDWATDNWTCDGVGQNTGNGFVALTLPPGDYIAEIIDCCVDVINTRHLWRGVAAIEYNGIKEVTGAGGTLTPDAMFSDRITVMFPDMGSFNNNADARVAYLGNTISFTHQGGQIRSWIVDPDNDPTNNEGQMIICIRPAKCLEGSVGSVPVDSGAIFVYRDVIDPLNLLGIIHPFQGTLSAKDNYGYGNVTAESYATRDATHIGPNHGFNITKSFFYHGPDGLSFYTIHGGSGTVAPNKILMSFSASGNSIATQLRVADDPAEITETHSSALDQYLGNWQNGTFGSDGLVFGPFDPPSDGAGWQIVAVPNELAAEQFWEAVGADGNSFTLAFNANGIGASAKAVIFTPIRSGCVMPFKQIQWLERGHRIGAACSCVVTIDSQKYIIVKRSLGIDITCGGGESLSNPCIAQFIETTGAHPAIAWPTTNGQEFIGIPTSGAHGFTFDKTFSDKVLAEMAAGHMTNIHGDPVKNIPFIIVPTAM